MPARSGQNEISMRCAGWCDMSCICHTYNYNRTYLRASLIFLFSAFVGQTEHKPSQVRFGMRGTLSYRIKLSHLGLLVPKQTVLLLTRDGPALLDYFSAGLESQAHFVVQGLSLFLFSLRC